MDFVGGKPGKRNHKGMSKLLDYQLAAAEEAVAHLTMPKGRIFGEEPLLVLPTGSGRTEVVIEVAARLASDEGHKVCFLADRTSELCNFKKPSEARSRGCDALMVHAVESGYSVHDYDVFIIDEAHELRESMLRRIAVNGKRYMGMTATPFRRGLQNHHGPIISGPTTNDMVRAGRLIRPRAVEENWYGDYRTAFDSLSLLGSALAFVPPRQLQACVSACREAGFSADYVRSGLPPPTGSTMPYRGSSTGIRRCSCRQPCFRGTTTTRRSGTLWTSPSRLRLGSMSRS